MMRRTPLLAVLLLLSALPSRAHGQQDSLYALWWNVENFFDTRDDPATNDDEFTPAGDRHWTRRRFNAKRDGIYKTLVMAGLPDVVGLAEVENGYVLRELCDGTPLRKAGYRYVHHDSPDRRGIDCALLYRASRFSVVSSRPIAVSRPDEAFFTRDILLVEGTTPDGDTVCLLLNHWPSRRGGNAADRRRMQVARTLRHAIDSLHAAHPAALILAMGDMNASPDDPAIAQGMGFGNRETTPQGLRNLTLTLPRQWGSYRYQGTWDYIDALFLLAGKRWQVARTDVLRYPHLLIAERRHLGFRPRRTYRGPLYEGGLSDHLPLLLVMRREGGR